MNNRAIGESIKVNIIRSLVLIIFVMDMMKFTGCVDFSRNAMQNAFYTCNLFLMSILIYEYRELRQREKNILVGILMGSAFCVFDLSCFWIFIVLLLNILWCYILNNNSYWNALFKVTRVAFVSMIVAEFYSICIVSNESLFNCLKENSFLYNFIDVLFVVFMIIFFVCKKENTTKHLDFRSDKTRRYITKMTKWLVWCLLIVTIWIIVANGIFVDGKNNVLGEFSFYIGKTIDSGYFIVDTDEGTAIFYVNKIVEMVGGVIENPTAYEYIDLNGVQMYQIIIAYIVKALYGILYGIVGFVILSIYVFGCLIYSMCKNKEQLKKEMGHEL